MTHKSKVLFIASSYGEGHGSAQSAIDVSRMLASNYKTYILTLSNNLSETNFYGCTPIYAYTLSLQFANKRLYGDSSLFSGFSMRSFFFFAYLHVTTILF